METPTGMRSLWELTDLLAARTATGRVLWREGREGFTATVAGHGLAIGDGRARDAGSPYLALVRDGATIDEVSAAGTDARVATLRALVDAARSQCRERERAIDGLIEGLRAIGGR